MCTAGCRTYLHDGWVIPSEEILVNWSGDTPRPEHYFNIQYTPDGFEENMPTTFIEIKDENNQVLYGMEWTAKNLKVSHFRNGDPIHECTYLEEFDQYEGSDVPAFISVYSFEKNVFGQRVGKEVLGHIYNSAAIRDNRGLAPDGWRIPTVKDWDNLKGALGDSWETKLKSTQGWIEENDCLPGTNEVGFYAFPISGDLEGGGQDDGCGTSFVCFDDYYYSMDIGIGGYFPFVRCIQDMY